MKRWKEFVAVRPDANTMFDLYSDTESAKTIKNLRDVVDFTTKRAHRRKSGAMVPEEVVVRGVASRGAASMRV